MWSRDDIRLLLVGSDLELLSASESEEEEDEEDEEEEDADDEDELDEFTRSSPGRAPSKATTPQRQRAKRKAQKNIFSSPDSGMCFLLHHRQ